MRCNLELSFKFGYFVLSFNQILTVQVSVRSDCFIQVLLLLQFWLKIYCFFLKLSYQIFLDFYFFDHLHKVRIGLCCFLNEFVSIFFNLLSFTRQQLKRLFCCFNLIFKSSNCIFGIFKFLFIVLVSFINTFDFVFHHFTVSHQSENFALLLFGLFIKILNFSCQSWNSILSNCLFINSVKLCFSQSFLFKFKSFIFAVKMFAFLFELSHLRSILLNLDGTFLLRFHKIFFFFV